MDQETALLIRRADAGDLGPIAGINMDTFNGQKNNQTVAQAWVECWNNARSESWALYHYFVIKVNGVVAGYAGWKIDGGFLRPNPVIELDQIGMIEEYRRLGFGKILMQQSWEEMLTWVQSHNDRIESFVTGVVWVYADNENAVRMYRKFFDDGYVGMRTIYGNRTELALCKIHRVVRPVRD